MQAIVLAAGFGSRLRSHAPSKPLAQVAGRPLLLHTALRLAEAGVDDITVVLGHRAEDVAAALAEWNLPLGVRTVTVADPALPNGVSALAAAPFIASRALLVMADHLVDPALYRAVAEARAEDDALLLGVDRRIGHAWIDEDDVTRVRTEGDAIVAIGKHLEPFNGYDTGVFSVGKPLFDALSGLSTPSLSQGVAALAASGLARAVETGDGAWLDVDDARALDIAERWLGAKGESAA
ncbi:NTP transferase domain-containing protein [Sphingosinicella microcystinivorans]|uniref:1L-myo-inositol 1-phosphate cytidylyltransferase n=1 Tax=Sphingosinicella microcystinivorans TaxID=335406 RepID=A0AAD1G1L4_SPHMI|nr:NTP transferase domain-containing protein [Sphingosinicella microcystinivorans]RKS91917.1 1L-myo-inositol 1-phosphate cytidylyltransferase [Sphingosinicella microcystinivorans]BBE34903.1 nucleotidyltransferase [Sphingosinicella microcystinivorans]